jgi:hypothetical protein
MFAAVLLIFLLESPVEGFVMQRPLSIPSSAFCNVAIHPQHVSNKNSVLRSRKGWRLEAEASNEDVEPEFIIKDVTGDNDAESLTDKIEGRKKRLQIGYKVSSSIYLVTSLLHLLRRGFYSWPLYYVFGGGTVTMAMVLFILRVAAMHDRLSSDTYKRLNLSVVAYSLMQFLLPVTGWMDRLFFKLPAILALINGVKGYGYGQLGWDKSKKTSSIIPDIKEGFSSSIKGLATYNNQSIGYVIGTAFLGTMAVVKLLELLRIMIFPAGETTANVSMMILSRASRIARLGLMTSIMYTLKDAADRGRLGGTTFIQLNYLMTAAFLTMTFYLSPTGPTTLGTISGALSVLTLYNGVTQAKK